MTEQELSAIPDSLLIDGDAETLEVYVNGKFLRPGKSQEVWNHSPDGFNWGYGGSGPAQLALAILLQFMPQEDAVKYHQYFKFQEVATWRQGEDFEVRLNLRQIIKSYIEHKI